MAQYIIPAILGFLGGLFLWLIKRERLALEYDIEESDLFPRDGGVGKYFVCKLINSGNRAIENISLNIEITEGQIDCIEYSNSQLLTEEKQTSTGRRDFIKSTAVLGAASLAAELEAEAAAERPIGPMGLPLLLDELPPLRKPTASDLEGLRFDPEPRRPDIAKWRNRRKGRAPR